MEAETSLANKPSPAFFTCTNVGTRMELGYTRLLGHMRSFCKPHIRYIVRILTIRVLNLCAKSGAFPISSARLLCDKSLISQSHLPIRNRRHAVAQIQFSTRPAANYTTGATNKRTEVTALRKLREQMVIMYFSVNFPL